MGGVTPEQHFAARPAEFRFESSISSALSGRQRLVQRRDGAFEVARPRLGLGQGDLDQPVKGQRVLLTEAFSAAAHALKTVG